MYTKNEALKLWQSEIGNKEYSYDFHGKKIKQEDYLEQNQVGWIITHIKPLELGGSNTIGNTIIMHHRTAEDKGIAYPKFTIDSQEYIVHYDKKGDFYYIEKVLHYDDDDEGSLFK